MGRPGQVGSPGWGRGATVQPRMFTGLVAAMGAIRATSKAGAGLDLDVDLGGLSGPIQIGDSIALSGACCTVVHWQDGVARFHLTGETLDKTWLGRAKVGDVVNLEAAMRAGDPLGGHLVQGHVDGLGELSGAIDPEEGGQLEVVVPGPLQRYCVMKGSITVDGVSLTIAGQRENAVAIAVIPHTAQVTTLGRKGVGEAVHIEVDVIAKYVEQMLASRFGDDSPQG